MVADSKAQEERDGERLSAGVEMTDCWVMEKEKEKYGNSQLEGSAYCCGIGQ